MWSSKKDPQQIGFGFRSSDVGLSAGFSTAVAAGVPAASVPDSTVPSAGFSTAVAAASVADSTVPLDALLCLGELVILAAAGLAL